MFSIYCESLADHFLKHNMCFKIFESIIPSFSQQLISVHFSEVMKIMTHKQFNKVTPLCVNPNMNTAEY